MFVLGAAIYLQIQIHRKLTIKLNSTLGTFSTVCPCPIFLIQGLPVKNRLVFKTLISLPRSQSFHWSRIQTEHFWGTSFGLNTRREMQIPWVRSAATVLNLSAILGHERGESNPVQPDQKCKLYFCALPPPTPQVGRDLDAVTPCLLTSKNAQIFLRIEKAISLWNSNPGPTTLVQPLELE